MPASPFQSYTSLAKNLQLYRVCWEALRLQKKDRDGKMRHEGWPVFGETHGRNERNGGRSPTQMLDTGILLFLPRFLHIPAGRESRRTPPTFVSWLSFGHAQGIPRGQEGPGLLEEHLHQDGPAKVQRSHFPAHLEEGLMQVVFGCILMTAPEIFWQHSFAIENLQLEICFCSRESNPSETQPIQV